MNSVHVCDLGEHRTIAHISNTAPLREALSLMAKSGVYSVPVYDGSETNWIGVLTLDSVVYTIVDLFKSKTGSNTLDALAQAQFTDKDVSDVTYAFNGLTVSDASVEPRTPLADTTTLDEAVQALLAGGQERIPVMKDDTLVLMLSPMSIVRYLKRHPDLIKHRTSVTLGDSGAVTKPIICAKGGESALYTFARMVDAGFSGMAVLDEEDQKEIVSILTLKDIKFAMEDFGKLLQGSEDFVKSVRQSVIETTTHPTINVDESEALGRVLGKLVAVGTHRMFVRDHATDKLVGIFSVTDLLKALVGR